MGQRHSGYDRKANDHYATPEWVTAALAPHLPRLNGALVWEPAAGRGKMADALRGHIGCDVYASDANLDADVPIGIEVYDFLGSEEPPVVPDAVITNPPYGRDAIRFIRRALEVTQAKRGVVAMLLRTQFDHAPLYAEVFGRHPAWAKKLMLTRRIVWFVDPDTGKPKAAPSDCHAWYIWDWRHRGPPTMAYGPDGIDEAAA